MALALTLALAASASAQEPTLPDDPVAKVGERTITKAEYDRWFENAAASDTGPGRVDPPDFERCIAAERRHARRAGRHPGRAALRGRCTRRHGALRRQVMGFLIRAVWIHVEADRLGIAVTPERVRRVFESQRRQAFPDDRAFRRFLRRSGATVEDILYRVELDLLQSRLANHALDAARQPTRREVTRFLKRHPKRFAGMPRGQAHMRAGALIFMRRADNALAHFVIDFQRRYHDMTTCAQSYVVTDCRNLLRIQAPE